MIKKLICWMVGHNWIPYESYNEDGYSWTEAECKCCHKRDVFASCEFRELLTPTTKE